jgi:hypothetical protein
VSLPPQAESRFYRFSFPVQDASHGEYYYAYLDASAPGVSVSLADGAAYQDGAAHEAHQPLDAQMAFRLVYAPAPLAFDLLGALVSWAGTAVASALLFVVPGWALLAWLWRPGPKAGCRNLSWAETLGLAVGIGLALYPLLLLWTRQIGLNLGPLYAWIPVIVGATALIWRYRDWRPRIGWQAVQAWAASEALWPDATLLILLALVFGTRFLVVRTLSVPMWGDSYQHTMIAQLLVDNGGLFDSWEPYVPLRSFTYHFGFHTAVSLYHWLTAEKVLPSVIIIGQIMNGLAVLSLYPLAVKVSNSRWAGVIAVLIAGLISPMPGFYLNWGRYVQLAGQVILPPAIWLVWTVLEVPPRGLVAVQRRRLGLAVLAGLTAAGLMLTHYRVMIFFLLFLPLAWAVSTVVAWRRGERPWAPTLTVSLIALVALLLVLPWAWHLFAGLLPEILGGFGASQATAPAAGQPEVWQNATFYVPATLLLLALLGLVVGLAKRRGVIGLIAIWIALLLLAANPHWLGLPGAATVSNFEGVLNSFTVLIGLYMPISMLCGYLGSVLIEALPKRFPRLQTVGVASVILLLSVLGARSAITILDPQHVLVTVPDLRAMAWIEEQTPETAKFLANSFFAYDDHVIVGSDAGWWIPLLAHRENTVPPITYGHEVAQDPDFISQVNDLAFYVESHDLAAPETVQVLKDNDITHVYVGQMGGHLPTETMRLSNAYDLVYHQDRVWIFSVR